MRSEFFQILQEASALFSWNMNVGVEYLDISEESMRIIMAWVHKDSETSSTTLTPKTKHLTIPQINNTISPINNTISPINNTTSSTNNTTSPTNNTISPTNNTTSSTNNTIPPINNIISPTNISISKIIQPQVLPQGNYEVGLNGGDVIRCQGDLHSKIFFLGEFFNYDDPVGDLFLKILKAMHLNKDNICLCTFQPINYNFGIPNIIKQVTAIRKRLEQLFNDIQLQTIQQIILTPQIICIFGDTALKILMGQQYMLTDLRGILHNYNGIHVMPTYHPAQIIMDKSLKRGLWEDIQQIMAIIGL